MTDFIAGPVGPLEVLFAEPPQDIAKNITGIICHPHPLMGGTMNNKVVTTLSKTLIELGLHTIRFNFRGVGESAGVYDDGKGEMGDLFAIWDWVTQHRPQDKIWLAGFSFGGYVSYSAALQRPPAQLVSIAPAIKSADLPRPACPWLVVQGDQDEVIDPKLVFDWLNHFSEPPKIIRMEGATHFFHGRLVELRQLLLEALS